MQISFDELKNKYANPSKYTNSSFDGTCYCVGGAFVCALYEADLIVASDAIRFPSSGELQSALEEYNPDLYEELAESFAGDIIEYNDAGKFEESWAALKRAMEYPR